MSDIVDKAKEFMKEHKLSQRMFSDLVGINYTTMMRGLQRKSKFSADTVKKIKKVMRGETVVIAGRYSKCNPPQSCFDCPLPDCNNNKVALKSETAYLQAGTAKDYIDTDIRGRQYDTSLHFCRKFNLLM